MVEPILTIDTATIPVAPVIAGFWRRLIAFTIDGILVGVASFLVGLAFRDFFTSHPLSGALVGLAIALGYFGWMGSARAEGQSFGKRLTEIEVVRRDGTYLRLGASVLRYLVLLVPLLVSQGVVSPSVPEFLAKVWGWVTGAAVVATVYLYLFNRTTRQSLHDLALGTYVVRAPAGEGAIFPRFWRGHWAILVMLMLVCLVLQAVLMPRLLGTKTLSELAAVERAVIQLPEVEQAGVVLQTSYRAGRTNISTIFVTVRCRQKPEDYERLATVIASAVLDNDAHATDKDYITIEFDEGFSVGFAQFHKKYRTSHKPEEWKLAQQGR